MCVCECVRERRRGRAGESKQWKGSTLSLYRSELLEASIISMY